MKLVEFKNHNLKDLEEDVNSFVYFNGKKWFNILSLNIQRIVGDYGEQWINAIIAYEEEL